MATNPVTPATAYEFDGSGIFRAALSPAAIAANEFVDGMLNLAAPASSSTPGVPQFRLIQVDADAAAFHTLDLLRKAAGTADGSAPADFTPAPLRSSGLSVVRSGNAENLLRDIESGSQKLDQIVAGGFHTVCR